MRIALAGDFDTYVTRGLERPAHLLPYRLSPGLNLVRGLREIGLRDVHILITTPEVNKVEVEEGPFGTVHRVPSPPASGSGTFFLWRRHLLLKELAKVQPDIVHGQGTEAEYALTAVTSPYPHVITFHGIMHRVHEVTPPPLFSSSHVPRWVEKLVARKARHVISISQDVDDFLKKRRSPARSYRIPNAMAPCFFAVTPQPRTDNKFAILYVGAIQPRKGLLYLVEALGHLRESFPDSLALRVIGPAASDYESTVKQRAAELKIESQIQWLGIQNERHVAETLSRSDVLVLPSFWENMPMCIGESLSAGVPVISTRTAGIPNWVDHEKTGLLVKPGDSIELAGAISCLMRDETLRHAMGVAGRAKAQAEYAPRVVAGKTLEVYETILRQSPNQY